MFYAQILVKKSKSQGFFKKRKLVNIPQFNLNVKVQMIDNFKPFVENSKYGS